jgi:mannosyltransferase OCH1-like enzyme
MIDKNILQTYETPYENLPEYIKDYTKIWKEQNSDWNYIYMDANQREDFVLKYFGEDWAKLFNSCPLKIMKANIWTYMTLYVYGGVFSDIDFIPKTPISDWLDESKSIILFGDHREQNDFCFTLPLIVAEKNHPILKTIIDNIKNKLQNIDLKKINYALVFNTTADYMFRDSIRCFVDQENVLNNSSGAKDYNDLYLSKKYGLFCYDTNYTYNVFRKIFVEDLDASKNWIGYNSWREETILLGGNNA